MKKEKLVKGKQIDSNSDETIQLLEEVLDDGSKVYSIGIFDKSNKDSYYHISVECINYEQIVELFNLICNESNKQIGDVCNAMTKYIERNIPQKYKSKEK